MTRLVRLDDVLREFGNPLDCGQCGGGKIPCDICCGVGIIHSAICSLPRDEVASAAMELAEAVDDHGTRFPHPCLANAHLHDHDECKKINRIHAALARYRSARKEQTNA